MFSCYGLGGFGVSDLAVQGSGFMVLGVRVLQFMVKQ